MNPLQRQAMGLPPNHQRGHHPGGDSLHLPPPAQMTPLQWDKFFDERKIVSIGEDNFNVYTKGTTGPIFYLLHGGGYSGLTWACFAEALCSLLECRVVAPDLRGHGSTATIDDDDLSTEKQVSDICNIYNKLYGEDSDEKHNVCVVGHSMGGALAVHSVKKGLIPNVVGLVVIDVVEGSAMSALTGMSVFLRGRPSSFESEEAGIKWCVKSGTTKNAQAARISMPAQMKKTEDGKYTWRVDLSRTEGHWMGWFLGLSDAFLTSPPPKLLVLAGVDRLDKALTIGQMQGKFQTTVLPKVGHAVHEDSPERLADELARFACRYKFATMRPGLVAAPCSPMC